MEKERPIRRSESQLTGLLPPSLRGDPRDLGAVGGGKTTGASRPALSSQLDGRRVLPIFGHRLMNLPGGDLHDVDGVGDHVGRSPLTFGCFWHSLPLSIQDFRGG